MLWGGVLDALRARRRDSSRRERVRAEYHAFATDPQELDNTAASLTPAQKTALHDTLEKVKSCHGAAACWAAQHLPAGAP